MRTASLLLALTLVGCAGARTGPAGADLTAAGTVLAYTVDTGSAEYPFRVTVTRNDDQATAFSFDLGDGRSVGTVRMSAAARQAAPAGMLNTFRSQDYTLDDRTSVWMARSDVDRLADGDAVTIRDGEGGYEYVRDGCDTPYTVQTAGGGSRSLDVCRYVSPVDEETRTVYRELCDAGDADSCTQLDEFERDGAAYILALDDPGEPLIVDMKTAEFRVSLQRVE